MEIWFIGGALVALMVYVSTRIKKSAAAAYGREIIETETYSFTKPEGFICPLGGISDTACFAHSKGFGETESTESLYQAEAALTTSDESLESLKSDAVSSGGFAIEDIGSRGLILRGLVTENAVEFKVFRRLQLSSKGVMYDFCVKVLCEYLEEFQPKADEMVVSFTEK